MSETNSLMSVKMETGIPLQPSAETAVFNFMKTFQEQSAIPHSVSWPLPPQLLFPQAIAEEPKLGNGQSDKDGQVSDELRHRFLAAAMAMMNATTSVASTCRPNDQPSMKVGEDAPSTGWEEQNLSSRLFSNMATSQVDASPPTVPDFPFMASSPFNSLPLDGFNFSHLGKSAVSHSNFVSGGHNRANDEDFCELCQKHFCNKYYLRKHKNDVHRILSEPFSQPRRRELGEVVKSEVSDTESNKSLEWMNILSNNFPSVDTAALSRKNSMEHVHLSSSSSEVNVNLNTSNEEDQQHQRTWMKTSPETSTPMVHFNTKNSFEDEHTRIELAENATFIPPVVSTQQIIFSPEVSSITSASVNSTNYGSLNSGALDIFKSSMAAAKLADRVVCDLCKKELCNKYFLRTHKIKVHGLSPAEVGGPTPRSSLTKSMIAASSDEMAKISTVTTSPYPHSNLINMSSGIIPQPPPPPPSIVMPPMFGFSQLFPQLPAPLGGLPMPVPWLPLTTPSSVPDTAGLMFNAPKLPNASPLSEDAKFPFPRLKEDEFQWDKENSSFNKSDYQMSTAVQLMTTNSLVVCPLCEKIIGPRLFLPTHLTSVHDLSPTEPTFFIFILSARSAEGKADDKVTEMDKAKATATLQSTTTNGNTTAANESVENFTASPSTTPFANPNRVILRSSAPQTSFTATTEAIMSIPDSNRGQIPAFLPFMGTKPMHHISAAYGIATSNTAVSSVGGGSGGGNLFDPVVPAQLAYSLPPPPPSISDSLMIPPVSGAMATEQQFISPLGVLPDQQANSLLPPPLGLIPLPAPPPSLPTPQAPDHSVFHGGIVNTTKWNPVQLAATGLTASSPSSVANSFSSKILGGSPARKSPNQMRVLCDICNKWICNKYFLRTHKANKHGISDPTVSSSSSSGSSVSCSSAIPTSSSQMQTGFKGNLSSLAVNPMHMEEFYKDNLRMLAEREGEKTVPEGSCEEFLALVSAAVAAAKENSSSTSVMPWNTSAGGNELNEPVPWLFPSALRGLPEFTNGGLLPLFKMDHSSVGEDLSMKPELLDRGFPLNLSLKSMKLNSPHDSVTSTSMGEGPPFKYGVSNMLNASVTSRRCPQRIFARRYKKPLRRRQQRASCKLLSLAIRLTNFRGSTSKRSFEVKGKLMQGILNKIGASHKRLSLEGESKPWQNLCQTCNAWFNKRSQLEAHLYATGHRRHSRPKSEATDPTDVYSLTADLTTSIPAKDESPCSAKLPAASTQLSLKQREEDVKPWWYPHEVTPFPSNQIAISPPSAVAAVAPFAYQMKRINEACTHMIRPITTFTENAPTI